MNPISQIPDYLNDQIKAVFKCPATFYGMTETAAVDGKVYPICKSGDASIKILLDNLRPLQFFHKVTSNITFDEEDDGETYGLDIHSRFEVTIDLVGIGVTRSIGKGCQTEPADIALSLLDGFPKVPVDVSDNLKAFHVPTVEINVITKEVLADNFSGFGLDRIDTGLLAFAISYTATGFRCEQFCITS